MQEQGPRKEYLLPFQKISKSWLTIESIIKEDRKQLTRKNMFDFFGKYLFLENSIELEMKKRF